MSHTMEIPARERDVIRLFAVDLSDDDIETFTIPYYSEDNELQWPLQAALGASTLDEDSIEVFPTSNLEDLGLAGYLIEGNGVPADQVDPMRSQLAQLDGYAMLIFSPAFEGINQKITPVSPLRYIATFYLKGMPVVFEPLPDESAQIGSGADEIAPAKEIISIKKKPSQAAMMGRVATYALLFLFALTLLIVWIGT